MNEKINKSLSYRPEIDGLRAFSVVLGILFHLDVFMFSNGFLGLEIFFVISGYLITKILIVEYRKNNCINFSSFYIRRVRRILPALFCTVFVTFLTGIFILDAYYIPKFANSVIHSLVGLSNFQFYIEDNYFDISSKLKPLLHTWSLGVEEQFYFIWPFFISLILGWTIKKSKGIQFTLLLSIFFLFLILAFLYKDHHELTFYHMPFRVFEFLFGTLIVFIEEKISSSKAQAEFFSISGFLLICYTIFFANEISKEHFYQSVLTCIGATLFVLYGNNSVLLKKVFSLKPITYIGKLSYSIYLIHWPVIVYFKHLNQRSPNIIEATIMISLTVFLAALQYKFIENKFRISKTKHYYFKDKNPFLVYATFLIPTIIIANTFAHGFTLFKRDNIVTQEAIQKDHDYHLAELSLACYLENTENKKYDNHGTRICKTNAKNQILTIGNSHEFDSYLTFKSLYTHNRKDINLVYSSLNSVRKNSCKFYFNEQDLLTSNNPECKKVESILRDYENITSTYNTIIVGAFGTVNKRSKFLIKYVSKLQEVEPNLKVIIHGSLFRTSEYSCVDIINRFNDINACRKKHFVNDFYLNEEQDIKDSFPNLKFTYLDRIKLFCPDRTLESCEIFINGLPIMFDAHHFNYHGMIEQVHRIKSDPELFQKLEKIIVQ